MYAQKIKCQRFILKTIEKCKFCIIVLFVFPSNFNLQQYLIFIVKSNNCVVRFSSIIGIGAKKIGPVGKSETRLFFLELID